MEKEVKTIGQEVTKAVETMKEAGKQGKQPQQQPEKEEKPDTPRVRGRPLKRTRLPNCRRKSTARRKSWRNVWPSWNGRKRFPVIVPHSSTLWISWMKRQESCKRTTLLKRPSINCDLRTLRVMAVIATSLPF